MPRYLEQLVDDAALFPPGNAPMPDAVRGHLSRRSGPWADLVGHFLCPASRLAELSATLDSAPPTPEPPPLHLTGAGTAPIELGVIADTGVEGLPEVLERVDADPRLVLNLVELPLPPADPRELAAAAERAVAAMPDVRGYLELPRVPGWSAALRVIADSAYGAKLRTGGLSAAAFPDVDEVAAFVLACVTVQTPFKATAGLHNAVRHVDAASGFTHHGFLNLLLATHAASTGGTEPDLAALLDLRDGEQLAERVAGLDAGEAAVARSYFVAFGSCSIDEPVADLLALGLLGAPVEEKGPR